MNLLTGDYSGSATPRGKIAAAEERSSGVMAERFKRSTSTRSQQTLLKQLDRAMAESLEHRLVRLVACANRREARAKAPDGVVVSLSRLKRPVHEMATERRDFEGHITVIPVSAELALGTMFSCPFVRASLLGDGKEALPTSSASGPSCVDNSKSPRWRTTHSAAAMECELCLPLPPHTSMRPIMGLRLEVLATDRANILQPRLIGSTEVQLIIQPSMATVVKVPLLEPPESPPLLVNSIGCNRSRMEGLIVEVIVAIISDNSTAKGALESKASEEQSVIWVHDRTGSGMIDCSSSSADGNDSSGDEEELEKEEEQDRAARKKVTSSVDVDQEKKSVVTLSAVLPETARGGAWVSWTGGAGDEAPQDNPFQIISMWRSSMKWLTPSS